MNIKMGKIKLLYWILGGCFLLISGAIFFLIYYLEPPQIKSITFSEELNKNNTKTMYIELSSNNNKNIYCRLNEADSWQEAKNKQCSFEVESDKLTVHLKYNKDKVLNHNIKDLGIEEVIYLKIADTRKYLAIGESLTLTHNINTIGNPDKTVIYTSSDEKIAKIEGDKVTAIAAGTAYIIATSKNGIESSIEIMVTNLIQKYTLNNSKKVVPCNKYTKEESDLLDDILNDIINYSGEETRGAVVNVTRFLPLQFKYKIPYFFENGRLVNVGKKRHVDGEGRYYHKGLYLHESKKKEITAKFVGPVIWGCGLTNYDDTYGWTWGAKYPNGMDCSGFVAWVLYNAGFDVGDVGSGISPEQFDLTDLGPMNKVTYDFINDKKFKVGDLIGWDGHIAIIAAIDDENIYIAESLLKGVVMEKFNYINKKSNFYKRYTHIVDMSEVYKKEGNYTDMWQTY